jgi:hypothetical protein
MSLHRATLALAAVSTVGMSPLASACCNWANWGYFGHRDQSEACPLYPRKLPRQLPISVSAMGIADIDPRADRPCKLCR